MNSHSISQSALNHRNNRTANDRHNQQPRAVAGQGAELRNPQSKNAGEHYRIKKTYKKNAPHRDMAGRQHGNTNQQARRSRSDAQDGARPNFLQDGRTDKSADNRASPIIRNVLSRNQDGNISNVRLAEIVD